MLLISSLFLLFGCQDNKSIDLIVEDVISLKMPIGFYPNRASILDVNKDTNIVQFNWRQGEIYIYKNGIIDSNVYLGYKAIFVQSLDSIYLIDKYKGNILLINNKFDSLNSWEIPININNTRYYMSTSLKTNFLKYDKKLYLTVYPNIQRDSFYTKPHEIIYSLKSKKIEKYYKKFPSDYSSKYYWGSKGDFFAKTINNKNEIIFMYPMNNSIFKMKDGIIEEIEMPQSKYLKDFPPKPIPNPKPNDNKFIVEFGIQTPNYKDFEYDKYRNLYYKIVVHSQPLRNGKIKNSFLSNPWSIMVFDEHYELLNEIKMPKNKYINSYFYILEDGLYVLLQDEDNFDGSIELQKIKVKYEN